MTNLFGFIDSLSVLTFPAVFAGAPDYRIPPYAVLALSDAYDAAIDLLMTDIVMPEISGRELARKLLIKCPTLKVLYMSGFAHALNAETHHGTVPDPAALEKPFTLGTLTRRIRWALDEQPAPQ